MWLRVPLLSIVVSVLLHGRAASAEPPPHAIDPKADALLKQMGEQLAGAKRFTFDSHSTVDQSMDNGQKVQLARNQKVAVRRPNGVTATVTGDLEDLRFWYDGKTVTMLNTRANAYGVAPAPDNLDATFDMLAEKYRLVIPLADLLFADPYKTLSSNMRSGQYLGMGYVL